MSLITMTKDSLITAPPLFTLPESQTREKITEALESMTLSASGWRKIFAPDGEEGIGTCPSPVDSLLVLAMGAAFADWLSRSHRPQDTTVLVARDTRPTGPIIADLLMRALLHADFSIVYLSIAASPEAIARAACDKGIHAFAYLSASHNPLGYNGVKFGLKEGVLGGKDAAALIAIYRQILNKPRMGEELSQVAHSINNRQSLRDKHRALYQEVPKEKASALRFYTAFLDHLFYDPPKESALLKPQKKLRKTLIRQPLCLIADFNGSARSSSIDRAYLEGWGIQFLSFHDKPGEIAHAILPEGKALKPCQQRLAREQKKNPAALLGYVPDNDGDRGNLVIWDGKNNKARILEAQEVFALSVLTTLALRFKKDRKLQNEGSNPPIALVVNGPTSLRITAIAEIYGVEVHEAEVGEANIIQCAEELRQRGYQVPLLGEGSNGGSVIYPSFVRDPLSTLLPLLQFLRLPSAANRLSPFEQWCQRIAWPKDPPHNFDIADILATLPQYSTTPVFADRAITTVRSQNHAGLKAKWEKNFLIDWALYAQDLEKYYDFSSWEIIHTEGSKSRVATGSQRRSAQEKGGFKVLFRNRQKKARGFLWMRASGTEPVFRIMADLYGHNPRGEKALIAWHRALLAEADRETSGNSSPRVLRPHPLG